MKKLLILILPVFFIFSCATAQIYKAKMIENEDVNKIIQKIILAQPSDYAAEKVDIDSESIRITTNKSELNVWSFTSNVVSRTDTIEKQRFAYTKIRPYKRDFYNVQIYNTKNVKVYEIVTSYKDDAEKFCDALYTWSSIK